MCKYYAILCEGLAHLWSLVSMWVLETVSHGLQGMVTHFVLNTEPVLN